MGIRLGCHVSGDDLGLDAAAAQIERCGDVGEIRVQMIGRDAKCACQSFGVKFEVDLSSCKFAFGQKSSADLTAMA
nr:hypothetical protein [Ruegeria arenilitoris]